MKENIEHNINSGELPEDFRIKLEYLYDKKIEDINSKKDRNISNWTLKRANELHNGGCLSVFGFVIFFTIVALIITPFEYAFVISICGILTGFILSIAYYLKGEKTNKKIDDIIAQINSEAIKQIENILIEKEDIYKKYCATFEDKVNKQSVAFSGSELTKEIIEWMSNGFHNTIISADRRSCVGVISVPFTFEVYHNKITCVLGTYDFVEKRCSFLETAIERAALANVLASEIQLNTVMKFQEDKSGTIPRISWTKTYLKDCVAASLHYEASNGFYEAVKKWN